MMTDTIEQLRGDLQGLKQQGISTVAIDPLLDFISTTTPTPQQLEHYKAQLQVWVEGEKHRMAGANEMFKSVIVAGQNAIRTLILMNGGAAVAILAYIGHLATINSDSVPIFARCLLPFTLGVFFGGAVSAGTYLSQWLMGGDPTRTTAVAWGRGLNVVVIVVGFLALVSFLWGLVVTYQAFVEPRVWRDY